MPTPASPSDSTKEPSTFIFNQPSRGGSHRSEIAIVGAQTGSERQHLAFPFSFVISLCCRTCASDSCKLSRKKTESDTLVLPD
jgi:hypothetical protein